MLLSDITKYKNGSHKRIDIQCDYCGNKFTKEVKKFYLQRKNINKDCCVECRRKKRAEAGLASGEYWSDEEVKILTEYYPICSHTSEIPIKNRTRRQIKDKAISLNIKRNDDVKQRGICGANLNRDFFSNINQDSAYFAGLIATDGNISGNYLSISLADFECVEALKVYLNYKGKISVIPPTPKRTKTMFTLSISSIDIVNSLKKYWNIVPKKSLILQPPNIDHLDKSIIYSFIIGALDGDGHIYKNKYEVLQLGLCGTKALMEWFSKHVNISNKLYKHSNIYQARTSGSKAIKIYNELKAIETPVKMFRKWRYNFSEDGQRLADDILPKEYV